MLHLEMISEYSTQTFYNRGGGNELREPRPFGLHESLKQIGIVSNMAGDGYRVG